MRELIDKNDAILAMMKEQMNDIKEYGCSIPECFDGDRAVNVLMNLPTIMDDPDISEYLDRLWKLAYERGKREGRRFCYRLHLQGGCEQGGRRRQCADRRRVRAVQADQGQRS